MQELSTTTSGYTKAQLPSKKKKKCWAGHAVVLRANTVKSNTGKGDKKPKKYHEAVDILQKRSLELLRYEHTENVHVDVSGRGLALNSYPVLMMTSMNTLMNDWDHWKPRPLSVQRPCTVCRSRLRAPLPSGGDCRK